MTEIWKDIKDFVGFYQVSSRGRVRSVSRSIPVMRSDGVGYTANYKGKVMTLRENSADGLYYVMLSRDGRSKFCSVSRLVADAFLGLTYDKPYVKHLDGNTHNNVVENLQVVGTKPSGRVFKPIQGSDGSFYSSIREASESIGITAYYVRKHIRSGEPFNGVTYSWVSES